jgi:hypothetical protein
VTVHLDRGYDGAPSRALLDALGFDGAIARKGVPAPVQAGARWVVERSHQWMNGYGKLRRCTEKLRPVVDFYLFLAAALVVLRQLIRRARLRYRWNSRPTSRRPHVAPSVGRSKCRESQTGRRSMAIDDEATKILLDERDIPTHWYNVVPDLPEPPAPVLHPAPGSRSARPTLRRCSRWPSSARRSRPSLGSRSRTRSATSTASGAPPRSTAPDGWRRRSIPRPSIYYKYEGVSPAGSHKPNTAVAQAYYNKQAGIRRLTTETGAGQWGTAIAMACAMFGLECTVYMVAASFRQKPYRRSMIQAYGATVHASPTELTNAGRTIRAEHPDSPGSLGIAISEASRTPPPTTTPTTRSARSSTTSCSTRR